ncbi:MAG: UDP-2,3-diacylglucosamine diphosphatase [Bacteroidales bacterium]|nr:UDP-2,3-diacylglucosamine diphosphatase [Bacteroidales bacterium]
MVNQGFDKKVYFVSDSHFGVPDRQKSLERERLFVQWLDEVKNNAAEIYLMGDLFEFWFEYKTVIPKGYTRLMGKLAEITDAGIPVFFFRGNHDVWAFSYLKEELNIEIISDSQVKTIGNKKFFLAHGDGLGKGDKGYKFIKKVFRNKINQWLFRWLHPDIGSMLGYFFSGKSRLSHENHGIEKTNGEGIKRLTGFCHSILQSQPDIDFFIFGHIHKPAIINLNEKSVYISLGDWIRYFSYAEFDGENLTGKFYMQTKTFT